MIYLGDALVGYVSECVAKRARANAIYGRSSFHSVKHCMRFSEQTEGRRRFVNIISSSMMEAQVE
jgi:hypothetical protein